METIPLDLMWEIPGSWKTPTLYKRILKDHGCMNYVAHMFGEFQFCKTLPLYSLILNSLIKSLSILLHIDSEFIFIHMIIHLYYGYNLRKVIS